MHGGQSGEADGVPHRHGQSRPYREARNRFFASVTPPAAPAVTLVEVSKLYGADFMIEIEAIAAA